jgi:serine/threonine-protein kinase
VGEGGEDGSSPPDVVTPTAATGLGHFIAEFKRRRVFRVLVAYGFVSFAVLQVIEPIMHGAHLGDWVLTVVLVALAVGFPVAVVLAWVFDLTEQGVTRTPSAAGPGAISLSRGRLALLLIGVGLVAALPGTGWYLWRRAHDGPAGAPAPGGPASIAVLPFADLSPQHDQEYFADGMAEEILDKLAKVKQLKVIGRTSSFSFKGKGEDLRTVGQKLGAGHVLEGSVRKEGSRVRITAQLIETTGGSHVWSETFERELTNVFALQEEVARAVASALKASLAPSTASKDPRPANPEAYNQYLLGLQFSRQDTEDGAWRALEAFRRALQLDPGFAQAQARLAGATQALYSDLTPATLEEVLSLKRQALAEAEKAVAIDPDLPDGYRARGWIRHSDLYDWEGARADLEKARALGPQGEHLLALEAELLATDGRVLEAIQRQERAAELEPLSPVAWQSLGRLRLMAGQLEPARAAFKRALEITPDSIWSSFWGGALDLLAGKPEAALLVFQRHPGRDMQLIGSALCLDRLGRRAEADRAIAELVPKYGHIDAYQLAEIYAARGDRDAAFRWLEQAFRQRDSGVTWTKVDPFLAPLRSDLRYQEFLRKLKLPVD